MLFVSERLCGIQSRDVGRDYKTFGMEKFVPGKVEKDRVIELTQPIQQLFRPVHITHVLRMCLRQGVAFQQGDGKFPISVLTQSTVENADCCV